MYKDRTVAIIGGAIRCELSHRQVICPHDDCGYSLSLEMDRDGDPELWIRKKCKDCELTFDRTYVIWSFDMERLSSRIPEVLKELYEDG